MTLKSGMDKSIGYRTSMTGRLAPAMLAMAIMAAGCGVSGTAQKHARIEIEEEVGFVITEEARISNAVRADYEEAVHLLEQGQNARAMELLAKAAEQAPYLSAPRIDLGIAHHRDGGLVAAEVELQKALEINPDHPDVSSRRREITRRRWPSTRAFISRDGIWRFSAISISEICNVHSNTTRHTSRRYRRIARPKCGSQTYGTV
jgi:Tfp pilus assembly protein PilF